MNEDLQMYQDEQRREDLQTKVDRGQIPFSEKQIIERLENLD